MKLKLLFASAFFFASQLHAGIETNKSLTCETLSDEANYDKINVLVTASKQHPVMTVTLESTECSAPATVRTQANGKRSLRIDCRDDGYEIFAGDEGGYNRLVRYANFGPTGVWAINFSCTNN